MNSSKKSQLDNYINNTVPLVQELSTVKTRKKRITTTRKYIIKYRVKNMINNIIENILYSIINVKNNLNNKNKETILNNKINHELSIQLNKMVKIFLEKINNFQLEKLDKNSIKGRANKRYVCGFNQTFKYINVSKIVFLARNIENIEGKYGLNQKIERIINYKNLISCFSLKKKEMTKIVRGKRGIVSVIAILDYSGCELEYRYIKQIIENLKINK